MMSIGRKERVFSFFQFRFKTKNFPSSLTNQRFSRIQTSNTLLIYFLKASKWGEISFPKKKNKNTQRHTKYFFQFSSKNGKI